MNRAVEIAHRDGILSAASLMVAAPAAAEAVEVARANPRLCVGLHLAVVEAQPMLTAQHIPDLVQASGNFREDMARLGAAIFFRPHVRRQMLQEVRAQFEAFRATGLKLDHVNAHRHFHLHPSIAAAIVAMAREFGVRHVRVPYEPSAALAAMAGRRAGIAARAMAFGARRLRGRLKRAGIASADRVFGLEWSGAMREARLLALLENLLKGTTEIYAHPATAGGFAGAAQGYDYPGELAALTAPSVKAALAASGARLGGFGDL